MGYDQSQAVQQSKDKVLTEPTLPENSRQGKTSVLVSTKAQEQTPILDRDCKAVALTKDEKKGSFPVSPENEQLDRPYPKLDKDNAERDRDVAEMNQKVEWITEDLDIPEDISLEELICLFNTYRLNQIEEECKKELKELKERQEQLSFLRKLLSAINAATDGKEGSVKVDESLQEMIDKAKEMGIKVPDFTDGKLSNDQANRFNDNIRMAIKDHDMLQEMQIQKVSRLTNERYESFKLARLIMKALYETIKRIAQAVKGG